MRAHPLPPKINAPQHDSRRRSLELRRAVLARSSCFDAVAEADELGFALLGAGMRAAFEIVHCRGRDRAGDLPGAVLHRELDDAAVLFVADEAAAGDGHVRTPVMRAASRHDERLRRANLPQRRPGLVRNCAREPGRR